MPRSGDWMRAKRAHPFRERCGGRERTPNSDLPLRWICDEHVDAVSASKGAVGHEHLDPQFGPLFRASHRVRRRRSSRVGQRASARRRDTRRPRPRRGSERPRRMRAKRVPRRRGLARPDPALHSAGERRDDFARPLDGAAQRVACGSGADAASVLASCLFECDAAPRRQQSAFGALVGGRARLPVAVVNVRPAALAEAQYGRMSRRSSAFSIQLNSAISEFCKTWHAPIGYPRGRCELLPSFSYPPWPFAA